MSVDVPYWQPRSIVRSVQRVSLNDLDILRLVLGAIMGRAQAVSAKAGMVAAGDSAIDRIDMAPMTAA